MKLIVLLFSLPFVQNLNKLIRAHNSSTFYEPIPGIDFAIDEFPKLSDVLPTLVKKTSLDYDNIPGAIVTNISLVDIEKLNMNKFKKKMDVIAGVMAKDEPRVNASRRQADIKYEYNYWQAVHQRLRRKCLDLMLQVVYMARHKIRKLQGGKYYSTTDSGFRIAYAFRMITRLFRRMMRFYSYARRHDTIYVMNSKVQIMIHGKIARLHVDLCYFWWVVIKVDGAHKQVTDKRNQHQRFQKIMQQQLQKRKDAEAKKMEQDKKNDPGTTQPPIKDDSGRRNQRSRGQRSRGQRSLGPVTEGRGQRSRGPATEDRGQPSGDH